MKELSDKLQAIAALAAKPGSEGEFTRSYQDLLRELTSAMMAMKQIALGQSIWLGR